VGAKRAALSRRDPHGYWKTITFGSGLTLAAASIGPMLIDRLMDGKIFLALVRADLAARPAAG
jgi:hypothetical protein